MIEVACSYCKAMNRLSSATLQSFTLTNRAVRLPAFACHACSSSTIIEISTKRARKGAGMKKIEAARVEQYEGQLVIARANNARIGAELCAETNCTCNAEIERRKASGFSFTTMGDSGHPLSTSWTRGEHGMMPNTPSHMHGCPRAKRVAY